MLFNIHHSSITRGAIGSALLVSAASFLVGCGADKNDNTIPEPTLQREQTTLRSTDSSRNLNDYTFEQREEFTGAMEVRLAELNREIDQLAMRIDASGESVRDDARPKLEELRAKSAALNEQLDEARGAEASGWSDLKSSISNGYAATKDGIREARQWTSEVIAP